MASKGKLAGKETEIVKLYKEGESTCTLASQFGVAPQSIWRILNRKGVIRSHQETNRIRTERGRVPTRPELRVFDRDEAIRMYRQGMCMQEIADVYHCSLGAISKVFHGLGISRNPKDAHFLSRGKGRWKASLHLGDKNPGWKGGKTKSNGYIRLCSGASKMY
jgi:transposase-like protein